VKNHSGRLAISQEGVLADSDGDVDEWEEGLFMYVNMNELESSGRSRVEDHTCIVLSHFNASSLEKLF
jgi:hypothetical protein